MAGVQIHVDVEDESVRLALRDLAKRAANLQPAFEEIGASLVTSTQQRFEDQVDPEGQPWPALAESTQQKKVSRGRVRGSENILRVGGDLYRSITYLARADEVSVGSNRRYAAIQQLGGQAGRGKAVYVPPRPYLGLSEDDRQEIHQILLDHLALAEA
jgi:phage virion morphogenesis protein